jgi:hypothetical protein
MPTNPRIQPIERATHKTWDEWLEFMEKADAKNLDHHAIATKVLEDLDGKIDSPAWWAQAVTVAYEQYIGRRLPGQRPDGTFQTSVSKSTPLSMHQLMAQWTEFASQDREILSLIVEDVKVGGTSNRLSWRTKAKDGAAIQVLSEPKGDTASLVVQLMGLPTQELNQQAKQQWQDILTRFLAALVPN